MEWIKDVSNGDFASIPVNLKFAQSGRLATLVSGYKIAGSRQALAEMANQKRFEASRTGVWEGTALELWLCLFFERRRQHFQVMVAVYEEAELKEQMLLDELCSTLRRKLLALSPDEQRLVAEQVFSATR